jgi:hypothetical protein
LERQAFVAKAIIFFDVMIDITRRKNIKLTYEKLSEQSTILNTRTASNVRL